MGLITGQEEIKSKAHYHIEINVLGLELFHYEGLKDAERAMKIAKDLSTKGYNPEITRTIVWDNTKSGYRTNKKPETKIISIEDLEEIVNKGEILPIHQEPIISSSYRCTSI